jgi:hypothetical protein
MGMGYEAWGPYLAMCLAGAAHIYWLIRREEAAARRQGR